MLVVLGQRAQQFEDVVRLVRRGDDPQVNHAPDPTRADGHLHEPLQRKPA